MSPSFCSHQSVSSLEKERGTKMIKNVEATVFFHQKNCQPHFSWPSSTLQDLDLYSIVLDNERIETTQLNFHFCQLVGCLSPATNS